MSDYIVLARAKRQLVERNKKQEIEIRNELAKFIPEKEVNIY